MRKFIGKILLFALIPLVILLLCYILIPTKSIIYRPWEALTFSNISTNAPFYPNAKINMNSVGDLCHHSKNAVSKKEYWKTDELGFRNDEYIKDADILIIGDSYVAGSGLTQANIISNQILNIDRSLKVYNMAPSSISEFDKLLKIGTINKPKLVLFSIVERNIPEKIELYNKYFISDIIRKIPFNINIISQVDCFLKFLPLRFTKARLNSSEGNGISGVPNSKMYFFNEASQSYQEEDLVNTTNNIISYKKYFDSHNIKFIFMPMPNKETVYFELVPFKKQSDYLLRLDSTLNLSGVSTINTLKIYNDYRKTNDKLLYHLDDTHWNSNATNIIASAIAHKIRANKIL